MITPTSSHSSQTLVALFDELEKIATAQKKVPNEKREAIKRAIKNAVLVAAGGGIGGGIYAGAIKPAIDSMNPETRRKIAIPAVILATAGSSALAARMALERNKKK